ncbi:unnamed protein product [Cladocopium goreaui]|uniref:Peptidase M28 domain-containing protein n=1 Tax=Cladocopium goreaui TaxID=2562237 RepID=A0A9P1CGM2_9DINO|nr:unnamed protein product [Cladocopium goreaui]
MKVRSRGHKAHTAPAQVIAARKPLNEQHGDNVSDIDPFVYTDVPLKEIRTLKVVESPGFPSFMKLAELVARVEEARQGGILPPKLAKEARDAGIISDVTWLNLAVLGEPEVLTMRRMQAREVRLPKASMTRMNPYAASLVQNELLSSPVKPKKTLVFACFAAEEPGLRGSKEFASRLASDSSSSGSSLVEDHDKTAAKLMSRMCGTNNGGAILQDNSFMRRKRQRRAAEEHEALVMDEIAWRSPSTDSPVVNLESYDWAKKVLKHLAGASKTHNGDKLKVTHSNNPFGSDHMSFLEQKIQSVLSIHGDDESYPHYHQPTDAMDQVNPELYTLITKMNAGAALRLAGVV